MPPTPTSQRPTVLLEAAMRRVSQAARSSVERSIEGLGLAALSSGNLYQRDNLLGAQFELNRRSAAFALAFDDRLRDQVRRVVTAASGTQAETDWDALSLVDDREVERTVAADRFGLEMAHACEWELRELDAYMSSLLGAAVDRHPLKPETIGLALIAGVEATTDRPEIQDLLVSEVGRVLAAEMSATYKIVIADLRQAGVQPAGLMVKATAEHSRYRSGYDSLGDLEHSRAAALSLPTQRPSDFSRSTTRPPERFGVRGVPTSGMPLGRVDAPMMSLIRRLAQLDPQAVADAAASGWSTSSTGADEPALPNVIRAHRDELRQASSGGLDHLVIDVVGTLFDAILSDPKIAPQMARQIGRLQLPVLRAALGDPSFFSSRKHPVRRFINRMASLAAAYDDFNGTDAQRFLARVRDLVQGIVDGDFEHTQVYEAQLAELERLAAELARSEAGAEGDDPAELLQRKEAEQRQAQAYTTRLLGELRSLPGPDFVRDFLAEVWSQVLLAAARKHGEQGEAFIRLRSVARDLFMSVQPKGSPAQRKEFVAQLPRLMQSLNEGLDLIAWPESARKVFFGMLLPAHAESLRAQPQGLSTLDFNLLTRRVEAAFTAAPPQLGDRPPPGVELPVLSDAIAEPRFSAEEAERVGLVAENAVDWSAPVEPAADAEPALRASDIDIAGLPRPEAPEPVSGAALADQVQLGFAYQMLLQDQWQKVKLAHVSDGRSFFMFTHGQRHKRTISLTHRMLLRLCEAGRLRAFENAYLLERATARARRQLDRLTAAGAPG